MRKTRQRTQTDTAAVLAAALLAASCAPEHGSGYEAFLSSLIEAEHAFAQAAADRGVRDAFQSFLADDGILFRPRATNAQEWLRQQPATPGLLSWEPAYADVSASGDLGLTTGPWSFRPDSSSPAVSHGNYFTIWRRVAAGPWKAVIDHGTFNPPPAAAVREVEIPPRPLALGSWRVRESARAAQVAALLQTDRAFAGASATGGSLRALTGFVSPTIRTLRNGRQPVTGIEAIRDLIAERPGKLTWKVMGGDVSKSGDFGYSYGEYVFTPADESSPTELGNYLRAWRRQPTGTWRVVVDLMTPLPPTTQDPAE
ncbi:MAG: DUF4440 domain-containing protein [Gemmatimonadota bacterium]|nr:MAG: DUF4440 domain-containing protein [Gemmatimonadota bacterium]